jgi:hypothetical protein
MERHEVFDALYCVGMQLEGAEEQEAFCQLVEYIARLEDQLALVASLLALR